MIEIATIKAKAKMPKVIHSQSNAEADLPISAPVTAIITAPPAASDIIFIDEALPMMSIQPIHRVALLVLSIVLFALVLELVRREKLKERYALLWLGTSVVGVLVGIFPQIIERTTNALHFQLLTTLYAISFIYVLGIILSFSVIISSLSEHNRKLVQEVALLANRMDALEDDDVEAKNE